MKKKMQPVKLPIDKVAYGLNIVKPALDNTRRNYDDRKVNIIDKKAFKRGPHNDPLELFIGSLKIR